MQIFSYAIFFPFLISLFGSGQINSVTINGDCLQGNRQTKTEHREIMDFTTLEVAGSFEVVVRCQKAPGLTISGEGNLLSHVIAQQEGKVLKIYTDRSLCAHKPLMIQLSTKQLQRLQAGGANDLQVVALASPDFELQLDGSGSVGLAGKVDHLKASISGSSDLHATSLRAKDAYLAIGGAASAQLTALEKLHVISDGASDVCYQGDPASVTTEINGVGDVEPCP